MPSLRCVFSVLLALGAAALAGACTEGTQSPPSRSDPVENPEGGNLAPLDLIYVCGNKFLATNATQTSVYLTYRVVGTSETGSLALPPAPAEDPGHSETELETSGRGVVELYQDDQRVARRINEGTSCGAPPLASAAMVASSADAGSWTAPFPWPVVAIHLNLLPTGKVLSWGLAGDASDLGSVHRRVHRGREPGSSSSVPGTRSCPTAGCWCRAGTSPATAASPTSPSSRPARRIGHRPPRCVAAAGTRPTTMLANGSVVILAGRDEVGDEVAEPEVWSRERHPGADRCQPGTAVLPADLPGAQRPDLLRRRADGLAISQYLRERILDHRRQPTLRQPSLRRGGDVRRREDPVCRRRPDDEHGRDHRPERRRSDMAVDRLDGLRTAQPERDDPADR